MAENSESTEKAAAELEIRLKTFRSSLSAEAAALLDELLSAAAIQIGKNTSGAGAGKIRFKEFTIKKLS